MEMKRPSAALSGALAILTAGGCSARDIGPSRDLVEPSHQPTWVYPAVAAQIDWTFPEWELGAGVGWQWFSPNDSTVDGRAAFAAHLGFSTLEWGPLRTGAFLALATTDLFGLDGGERFAFFQADLGAQAVARVCPALDVMARVGYGVFHTAEVVEAGSLHNLAGRGPALMFGIRVPDTHLQLSLDGAWGAFRSVDTIEGSDPVDRPYSAWRAGVTWVW